MLDYNAMRPCQGGIVVFAREGPARRRLSACLIPVASGNVSRLSMCENVWRKRCQTESRVQAVISNRKARDLFACKWLRAPDLN